MLVQPKTVVMLAPSQWPQMGGVETHLGEISRELKKFGWEVTFLVPPSQRPAGKIGLIWLWFWVLSQWRVFLSTKVIHIHDVFLWFWPVWPIVKFWGFLNQKPIKIITTFHGWEGIFPPTFWQKFNKWLAQLGSSATVAVGAFIEKFYPIKPSLVVYGGVAKTSLPSSKKLSDIWIYLGRLNQDTGLAILLSALVQQPTKIEFWGAGPLLIDCQKSGEVKGWVENPVTKLAQLSVRPRGVIAGGYLAVLEALSLGLKVLVIADNPLKLAYYQLAPFAKYLTIVSSIEELGVELQKLPVQTDLSAQAKEIRTNYSWTKLAADYLKLYEA